MNLSTLLEMLDALKTTAGEKFFGRMLAMMLYELNDSEAMSVNRNGPHSRSTARTRQHHGTRDNLDITGLGDVMVRIPSPPSG